MNRKILLTIVFIFFGVGASLAQEVKPERKQEIGIGIYGLDTDFSLAYKFGTETSLWRLKAVLLDNFLNETNIGLRIGIEFRKPIRNHLDFVYGADLSDAFLSEQDFDVNIFGINAVIGANYHLTENVLIGAEINPFVGLTAIKPTNSNVWERDFFYRINNSGAELFIAIEF
jgi:hypothetical protein